MFKSSLTKLILFFTLLFFTTLVAADNNTKPLILVLDWFVNPDHAPIFVAQQQGFFQQQGIDVKIVPPADPDDAPKLVAVGKADLAISYQPHLVTYAAQGLPLVRIATLVGTPLTCLAVLADGPIHSISDLEGKKIGYGGGATEGAMLSTMLKKHGLSLQDVNLINVKYSLTQALLAKKVDAVTSIVRNFEPIEMELAGHPARLFFAEENGMPPYEELIILANKNNLKDARLPKFLTALDLGVQYLINHPEESWQKFAKAHPELNNELNHRAWLATLPRFALRPAALDRSRYDNLALFMQKNALIKVAPSTASYAIELPHN